MAMLWCDGFELGSVGAVIARYDSSNTSSMSIASADGRTNQYLTLGGGNITKHVTNSDTLIIGFARKTATFSAIDILKLDDTDGNRQLTLREVGDGTITLYRGDPTAGGTALATSPVIDAGFWVYYELKFTIHSTVGAYEFRINETTQFSAAGVNTQNTIRSNVERVTINGRLVNNGVTTNHHIDDLYIANTLGASPIGYFFGNTKIEVILPNGAGGATAWTPSSGSNWQNVDENPHNSDTDYNYSSTVNQSDLYTMGNLSTPDGRVRSVQLTQFLRKDDALLRQTKPIIRVGSVNYLGGNDSLTTSYLPYYEIWDQNPATSSEWGISTINAIETGILNFSG